jgi:hypothetical protein
MRCGNDRIDAGIHLSLYRESHIASRGACAVAFRRIAERKVQIRHPGKIQRFDRVREVDPWEQTNSRRAAASSAQQAQVQPGPARRQRQLLKSQEAMQPRHLAAGSVAVSEGRILVA